MDSSGLQGLSYIYSPSRFSGHPAINDLIESALQKALLPLIFELPGLNRNGTRSDGITVFSFSGGGRLAWYCTWLDTFAGVHLNRSAMEAGPDAKYAEERSRRKYAALAEVATSVWANSVKTIRGYDGFTVFILRAIGHDLIQITTESWEANWFGQNLAIVLNKAMRSWLSQPVLRNFRGSRESSYI